MACFFGLTKLSSYIQFCFINYRMNGEENEEVLAYSKRMSNIEDFETMQEEYFSFLEEQRQKGNNGIVRNKYLVFFNH
ncbi:hypothetical protein ACT7DB_17840 [Bacillus cereus]